MDCDFVILCLFIFLLNYDMFYLFYFNVFYKLKVILNLTFNNEKFFKKKRWIFVISLFNKKRLLFNM